MKFACKLIHWGQCTLAMNLWRRLGTEETNNLAKLKCYTVKKHE